MIRFNDVTFKYSDKPVLNNFSKTFEDGKIYILSGESGSGKTTLLKLAYGVLKPGSGTVSKDYKKASFIFDKDNLFDTTVLNNLKTVTSDISKIDYYLNYFNLLEYKNINVNKLSNGQKRRIVIIRCFLNDADTYFIDEAIRGLDEDNVKQVINLFKKEFINKTVIYVTHNPEELSELDHEVIKL